MGLLIEEIGIKKSYLKIYRKIKVKKNHLRMKF